MATTTLDLSDVDLDLSDDIEAVMMAAPASKSWTPSELGRRVKADSVRVRNILDWMVAHRYISSEGNGARTRYSCLSWRRNCG